MALIAAASDAFAFTAIHTSESFAADAAMASAFLTATTASLVLFPADSARSLLASAAAPFSACAGSIFSDALTTSSTCRASRSASRPSTDLVKFALRRRSFGSDLRAVCAAAAASSRLLRTSAGVAAFEAASNSSFATSSAARPPWVGEFIIMRSASRAFVESPER